MNRIIKFRAWDSSSNRMYGPLGQIEFFTNDTYLVNEEIPVGSLMQFTGLLDSKGVEIYEGDIVRGYDFKGVPGENRTVEFSTTGGWVANNLMLWALNRSEVVGNVWENPDLLK